VAGGDSGKLDLPTIGVSPLPLIEEAIGELSKWGHSRICMPIIGVFPSLREVIKDVFENAITGQGHNCQRNWNTPSSELALPEVVGNMLNRVFSKQMPTALIAMTWRELIAIECFLRDQRLRIPQDISIILLAEGGGVEWYQPALTRFHNPTGNLLKVVRRWIEDEVKHEPKRVLVPGVLLKGESVGPPATTGL
jgi:DNA-binding LacI/PurR family transcriptional regulator